MRSEHVPDVVDQAGASSGPTRSVARNGASIPHPTRTRRLVCKENQWQNQ